MMKKIKELFERFKLLLAALKEEDEYARMNEDDEERWTC